MEHSEESLAHFLHHKGSLWTLHMTQTWSTATAGFWHQPGDFAGLPIVL